ncbi:hypothetical protein COW36_00355 [bacterium (Candidatus Blackallbacteria) CG17_big_fil_post_rev_8_21_14_2_50_48_46]|uniref:Response regulatory domain-containing protein n=1 Tax=bacterium (Candidatus Blackallbacteria) CG17_big_fil_post_rev_8_21_14_2_50_48_46 TaxID=2014261 RepID=A0A2M7GAW9_9BACT|nr:MAG: hypothetical protein COW64_10815 [bacterium (Candidatus Blackallbacteria) CG18_big_fil_WC_8_21_14_2_50_49_26]PIW19325.1 MAG: hypothetical protein COW36_00355 [bacterium (Candidatus Blackallbacteria) CG17_big_fil_post_rev_8_21_14_2_50_48_46]PIW49071.1 MAG: hypothetical protein COW20_08100 [bacterium (Candidatus Blackallbacteria) CG13_big_fil_rev_8_21_14_2_50_49_14]
MTKVLIAEDSTIIQKLLSEVLKKDKSIEVVGVVSDGMSAVEQTKALNPDIVLMDYRMPKQNAPAAIKQIMSSTPKPIMVITSAEPFDEKRKEVMDLGAVGFMEKPKNMDFNALSSKIISQVQVLSRLKPAKKS